MIKQILATTLLTAALVSVQVMANEGTSNQSVAEKAAKELANPTRPTPASILKSNITVGTRMVVVRSALPFNLLYRFL